MNKYEQDGCIIELNMEHERFEDGKLFSLIDKGYIQRGVKYTIYVTPVNLLFGLIEVNKDIVPNPDRLTLKPYGESNMDKKILNLLKFINDKLELDLPYSAEEEIVYTQRFRRVSGIYTPDGTEVLNEEKAERILIKDIISGGHKDD